MKRGKKEAAKKSDEQWETKCMHTTEKKKIEDILKVMQLPIIDESFTSAKLMTFTDSVCLRLMVKDHRWEQFLLDTNKKKCKKYLKLQE